MAGKETGIIPHGREFDERKIQSECGLFAIYYPGHDVRKMTYVSGTDLQHRAEGAAGMYVSDGKNADLIRNLGTVGVVFQEGRVMPRVEGHIAVLHTRYPTAGSSNHMANIQPLSLDGIILAHHGNLTNAEELRERFPGIEYGEEFPDSDSWLALNAIAQTPGETLAEKLVNAQRNFEGGWAFILTDGKQLVASRDRYGIRPLSLGYIGDCNRPEGYALSVETATFKNLGISDFREVLPGETIVIDESGVKTVDLSPNEHQMSCIFEFVYMMRPDSEFLGENVHMTRKRAGQILWQEQPVEVGPDEELVIMPIPDSGRPSALGLFDEAKKQLGDRAIYYEALLANRYFGRNFIKSVDKRDAFQKFYVIKELIKDRVIVLVDDSQIRGDTTRGIVDMLLEAGAKAVHERVASPEITRPCFWGVAFSTFGQLIANNIPDLTERARSLRLASIAHLSLPGLFKAVGMSEQEMEAALKQDKRKFCTHCFDGNGPEMKNYGIIKLREFQRANA